MIKARKLLISFLVTVLCISALFAGTVIYSKSQASSEMEVDADVYDTAENTLKSFLGLEESNTAGGSGNGGNVSGYTENGVRMTQRVTVMDESGVLPISGTVTKSQDAYYPGTYELKFSNRAILTTKVNIYVKMDVEPGEQVYILTGDKDKGYKQVAVVSAEPGCVTFETALIQDYTLSKTDIISAQAAVASVMKE